MKRKFVETNEFRKLCKQNNVKEKHILSLQNELLENPKKGALIVGSGGARKIRVASDQKGKSGSYRVLYTDFESSETIYFWIVLDKAEADNISSEEKALIKYMNKKIKDELSRKKRK